MSNKMKTNKAARSRFKVTGTGKLKKKSPGMRHILSKKTSKRKRHLKKSSLVAKAQSKMYAKMMGV